MSVRSSPSLARQIRLTTCVGQRRVPNLPQVRFRRAAVIRASAAPAKYFTSTHPRCIVRSRFFYLEFTSGRYSLQQSVCPFACAAGAQLDIGQTNDISARSAPPLGYRTNIGLFGPVWCRDRVKRRMAF